MHPKPGIYIPTLLEIKSQKLTYKYKCIRDQELALARHFVFT